MTKKKKRHRIKKRILEILLLFLAIITGLLLSEITVRIFYDDEPAEPNELNGNKQ